jgi:hypothetical protein
VTLTASGTSPHMASEADLTRALNALAATLNDQQLREFEVERIQELANSTTGGEIKFLASGSGTSGELREASVAGEPVAHISLERGVWSVKKVSD